MGSQCASGTENTYSLTELAAAVRGIAHGELDRVIKGAAGLEEAGADEITFADPNKTADALASAAGGVLISPGQDGEFQGSGKSWITVDNPRLAFSTVLELFRPKYAVEPGVSPLAAVSPGAELGKDVSVGPHATVESGAVLGDGVILYPGVYVGHDARIGDGTILQANVVVREQVTIGERVLINPGAVIGGDGFGFVTTGGKHYKVPQIGTVVIGDDVEIGANVTIDRATCGATVIGRGTKIDNLVMIGHNCVIGEDCLLVSQVGIAGSSKLGNHCTLAGKAGVAGHLEIGDGCVVMAQGVVISDLPAGSVVSGMPARPHAEDMRVKAATYRLPDALKELRRLKDRLAALEELIGSRPDKP